jgi:hypothetical protein
MESLKVLASSQIQRSKLWHLLVGMVLGAGMAVSMLFPSAVALEQARKDARVNALFFDLGRYLCEGEGGFKFITPVGHDRYRFDCKSGRAIEERVVFG